MPEDYRFRPATEADLPLLRRWRAMPHVVEWWGAPDVEPEDEKLTEPLVAMTIVEHEGRPFAFIQDYSPHDWDPHPFSYLPPGSRGIDHYIGEPDMIGRGHGSAFIRFFCDRLFVAGASGPGQSPRDPRLSERGVPARQRTHRHALGPGDPDGAPGRHLRAERCRCIR